MGTRCLTVFNDDKSHEIAVMYRQFDGYPECHGAELKAFLGRKALVNGFNKRDGSECNGMPDLAAQIVAHFKTEPGEDGKRIEPQTGGYYLYPAGTRDCGEEFVYTLYPKDGKICLRVQAGSVTYFGLPGTPQAEMAALYDGPIAEFNPERQTATA